jgi:DNA-binding transcriptional LysR family regulator
MEWEQLEYFQTLARMQHVTKAAQALSITQPALSRSIVRLEDSIGVPLFDRQGRSLKLNKYGALFLNRVDTIIREYKEGREELQSLVQPDQGEVSFGFLHTLGTAVVPYVIGAFQEDYPKVQFQLRQNHSNWLLQHVINGKLDLCLLASPTTETQLQWTPLWEEELFLFLPNKHKFASRDSITLDEITEEPFVLMKEGFALRMTTDHIFEQVQIRPRIMFEGEEMNTIAGFVAAGLGLSILPDFQGMDQANLAKVRISWPICKRTIGISWMEGKYLSPVAEAFKQYIINHFHQAGRDNK